MTDFKVKNKDGTINKEEKARIKKNTKLMELERKKDMFGKPRKKRITEIPRDAVIKTVRKVMSKMPGKIGDQGKKQLALNRMAKELDKKTMEKKSMQKKMYGGKVTKRPMGGKVYKDTVKRPMGGKVYKVDNTGQMMVQKMYGGKVKNDY